MISIERIEFAFADIHASEAEWSCLRAIVRHAVEDYDSTNLDYILPSPAETRARLVEELNERLTIEGPCKSQFHMEDLRVLLIVVSESDRLQNPDISIEAASELRESLERFSIKSLFSEQWFP